MRTIEGYDVKIFTDNVEETALSQIRELLSIDVFASCPMSMLVQGVS